MKWRKGAYLLALGLASLALAQTTLGPVIVTAPPPPPTLPAVVATAPRTGGGTIICRDSGCAGVLATLRRERIQLYAHMQVRPPPIERLVIDQKQFCARLKGRRPAGCNPANPPSSPGIVVPGKSPWTPNGCGTGGVGGWFQNFVLKQIAGRSYSGNINEPYPGVSFLGACNSQDQCWASGGNRGRCDLSFASSMASACNQLVDRDGIAACQGFASLYHGAVSTTNGSHSAYANVAEKRVCVVWANGMRENHCGK